MSDDFTDRRADQLEREGENALSLAARFRALEHDGLVRCAMVLAAVVEEMGGTIDVQLEDVMAGAGQIIDFNVVDGTLVRVSVRA